MDFALGPRAAAAGYRLVSLGEVGSTNAEALARLRGGEKGPLWVVTANQTGGRGRRQRPWSAPPGNLAASLLLTLPVEAATAASLGFVAGLALVDALAALSPASFQLKWPNDVLANKAKIAGILLESERRDDTLGIVVGIGVNICDAPAGTPYPATALRACGCDATAGTVFAALADSWVTVFTQWAGGNGLEQVLARWCRNAAGIGDPIAVATGGATIEGIFDSIDREGRLVVAIADGRRITVSAGDVHFGPAATTTGSH